MFLSKVKFWQDFQSFRPTAKSLRERYFALRLR